MAGDSKLLSNNSEPVVGVGKGSGKATVGGGTTVDSVIRTLSRKTLLSPPAESSPTNPIMFEPAGTTNSGVA